MFNSRPTSPEALSEIELLDASPKGAPVVFNISSEESRNLPANLLEHMKTELESAIPWFLEQMPILYREITPPALKQEHVIDIVTGQVLSNQETAERSNSSTNIFTIVAPGDSGAACNTIAAKIGKHSAKFGNIFLSNDKRIAIGTLNQGEYRVNDNWTTPEAQEKRIIVEKKHKDKNASLLKNYLDSLDTDYIGYATSRMISIGFDAYEYCHNNENLFVNETLLNETENKSLFRLDIGLKEFPVTSAIQNVTAILTRYNMCVERILSNEVRVGTQQVAVLHVLASTNDGKRVTPDMREWNRVIKSIKTLSYVDHADDFSVLLQGRYPMSLNEINLIRSMANWAHIFLTKVNPYYYSLDRVSKAIIRNDEFLVLAIDYFRARFDPRFDKPRAESAKEISDKMEAGFVSVTEDIERSILRESLNFLRNILKTNYFIVSKGALAFRVDPKVLNLAHYPETPFGIFFLIGRNFRAFQVRYRDIARGGVRVVIPRTEADFENALAGLFDEVNGLAYAQQLKNKDIPEGGSKCVFVLKPGGDRHLAVKSGISGLLDLITTDKDGKLNEKIVDHWGQEEIIYLGPDENLTDDLIVWTIQHALHRGYKYAYAFMSSKPDFGINHKTYGVTSEGVNVYVDNVLRYLKLNTQLPFRIKMTGGPDGDVAGNELKILHREYGERAHVVAIADGYGAAYDPKGLNWSELLRLVKESKSIVEFNPTLLNKDVGAFVIKADTKENIKRRDTLYATVEAEIFIPAGGRPYTVKESNWQNFLMPNGTPSARAIVEGANIFFTPEARKKLVESGIVVIKDSSANKAGVICSSYEIIACLTVSPQEFAEMKTTYVSQVVTILKDKADLEAKLLFNEWRKRAHETNLVDLSYEVSLEINRAKDIVREHLDKLSDAEFASEKFLAILCLHCPNILVEKYKERIATRLPRPHKIAIISAYMASHLIYSEGLNWLDTMDSEQVYRTALEYMNAERLVEAMAVDLGESNLPNKDKMLAVLRGAGAKYLASYQN